MIRNASVGAEVLILYADGTNSLTKITNSNRKFFEVEAFSGVPFEIETGKVVCGFERVEATCSQSYLS